MRENIDLHRGIIKVPGYPDAPIDWDESEAWRLARDERMELSADHLEVIRALQAYYAHNQDGSPNVRELHDALDERFHQKGGIRYLYTLFPGGPVAQGCLLAGLPIPAGARNASFGSVQ